MRSTSHDSQPVRRASRRLVRRIGHAIPQPSSSGGAVFVAYYWRARPGQAEAYGNYIKNVAEPIDEKRGVPASSRKCAP